MAQAKQLKFKRNPRIRYRDNSDTNGLTPAEFRLHELCCALLT